MSAECPAECQAVDVSVVATHITAYHERAIVASVVASLEGDHTVAYSERVCVQPDLPSIGTAVVKSIRLCSKGHLHQLPQHSRPISQQRIFVRVWQLLLQERCHRGSMPRLGRVHWKYHQPAWSACRCDLFHLDCVRRQVSQLRDRRTHDDQCCMQHTECSGAVGKRIEQPSFQHRGQLSGE